MEVSFNPYNKITFQSYLPYENAETFAKVILLANPRELPGTATLFWANGILFRMFIHPNSETRAKQLMDGHIMYDHIEFAPMPQYKSEIQIEDRPLAKIYVLNVTNHTVLDPLTKWIYDNLIKKKR